MKSKRLICLLLCMFAWLPLSANNVALSFKVSAYRPTDDKIREIFNDWLTNYQVELDVVFGCFNKCGINGCFNGWASVNYFGDSGHSIGLHQRTTIDVTPLTAGIDIVLPIWKCFSGYFGGGPRYYWVNVKNDGDCMCIPHYVNRDGWGGVLRAGTLFEIGCCFWGDIFVDYSFYNRDDNSTHFCYVNRNLDLSGVSVGGGFRYRF